MKLVTVKNALHYSKVLNGTFEIVKGGEYKKWTYGNAKRDGKVTVKFDGEKLTLWVNNKDKKEFAGSASQLTKVEVAQVSTTREVSSEVLETGDDNKMTDKQLGEVIEKRFQVMDKLTDGILKGQVKSLIISGASGVGKSYELSEKLEKAVAQGKIKYTSMSGTTTAIGLYKTLFAHSGKNELLVLDDIDRIFGDEDSMNVLKAALDTGKKRTITWMAESSALRAENIPQSFDFEGSIVFITNLNFDKYVDDSKSKIGPHIKALLSRTVYLDLCIHTLREIMIRIEQVIAKGDILAHKNLDSKQKAEIIVWIRENHRKFRTLSLREVLHLGDIVSVDPKDWKEVAEVTMFDPRKVGMI